MATSQPSRGPNPSKTAAALPADPTPEQIEKNVAAEQATHVGRNVLARVGRPAGFIKVAAHHLFGNAYRVNIWGDTPEGARIVHSEFVRN